MVSLSKEMYAKYTCRETPCSILHMWSSSCIDGIKVFGFNSFIGCLKFFGPIYMIKLLLNWKKINGKYLARQSKAFLRSIMYGVAYVVFFIAGMCALANTIGVNYYNVLRAGLLSGLAIVIEDPENRMLNTMLLFNQAMEGIINVAIDRKSKRKENSQWLESLVFMCISSTVMYLFKTQDLPHQFQHLWFYPGGSLFDKSKKYWNLSQEPNTTRKVFLEHVAKESFKYFCMGYLLEIVKKVLSRFDVLISRPKCWFSILCNKKNVLFGLFFGGFAFLYRCISYYLFKRNGGEHPNHALIAGFMAGSTYFFRPNVQVAIIGFTTMLKIISYYLLKRNSDELPSHALIAGFIAGSTYYFRPNIQYIIIGLTTILQFLWQRLRKNMNLSNEFPWYVIIICLSTACITHVRAHLEHYCPKYSKSMMDLASNNIAALSFNRVLCLMSETDNINLFNNSTI